MSEENAWKMVTLNPAILLHLDDKVGSVKVGKDADLVLWSDHPLSVYAKAEKTLIDIERVVESSFIATGTTKNCPSYTTRNINNSNTDTLIIDFGEVNCVNLNQLKRGKIIAIYSGYLHDSSAIINTTFNNFYINNNLIQGNMVLENLGLNINENYAFNLEVNNLSITTNNGIINLNADYKKELIAGSTTKYQYLDDIYLITGSAIGNSVNGNDFNMLITDSLLVNNSCIESSSCIITKGKSKISPVGYQERTLDYGNNLCDCKINAEINNNSYLIVIN
jgi:hypothetical protein